jgi:hypothetical protein
MASRAGDGSVDISGIGAGSVLDREGGSAATGGEGARSHCEEVERGEAINTYHNNMIEFVQLIDAHEQGFRDDASRNLIVRCSGPTDHNLAFGIQFSIVCARRLYYEPGRE